MLAAPFDIKQLALTGDPLPVLDDLNENSASGYADFSISENGTLAYIRSSSLWGKLKLVRFDRDGNVSPIKTDNKFCISPRISPDGKQIAMTCYEPGKSSDIWTYDVKRETLTRITLGDESELNPLWTDYGQRLIYQSEQPQFDLYRKSSDGSGSEELLRTSPRDKVLGTISSDGKIMVYSENDPQMGNDLWRLPLEEEGKPEVWLQTRANENFPSLSPDGHWLAYVSDESRRREIYILPFPEKGERIQVTKEGGDMPLWSSDEELFFLLGTKVMFVPIIQGKRPEIGKPSLLFDLDVRNDLLRNYDVSPNSAWFVGLQRDPTASPDEIEVKLNWFEELKEKVPIQ